MRAAFPDFHNQLQELIVDADARSAAARLQYSGTDMGPIFGIPASERQIGYAGATFVGFDGDARIVRVWVLGELVTLLTQLGLREIPVRSA